MLAPAKTSETGLGMIRTLAGRAAPHIPVLETERLVLRGYRVRDLDDAAALWSDPRVVEFIGGAPRSRPDVWMQMQRSIGSWGLLGYGYWAIEHKSDSRYVGELGFLEGLRDIAPALTGKPEMGWALGPDFWGQGYASEAALAALRWAGDAMQGFDICCIIEPGHAASLRIAEKCGFARVAETSFRGKPILQFGRTM